jgi:hypothetical protein
VHHCRLLRVPDRLNALVALIQSGYRPELGFLAAAGGKKGGQGIKVETKEKEVAVVGGHPAGLDWALGCHRGICVVGEEGRRRRGGARLQQRLLEALGAVKLS